MEPKTIGQFAALLGAIAVVLGALGAHALKSKISPEQLASFETAVKYQFYHAFALLFIYLLSMHSKTVYLNYSAWLIFVGVILFSGSIYLLSTRTLFGMPDGLKFLGPITPLGGLLMIAGWVMMVLHFIKERNV